MSSAPERELVLVGGGHAHVQVIRRFAMRPVPGVRLSVVLDRAVAVYSGMVPGFVAGDYAAPDLEIDVLPLARRARARVVLAAATRVDAKARQIVVEGRPPIRYDLASLDVGSTVRGLSLPGVREHSLTTRPIRHFVDRLEARLAGALGPGAPGTPLRIALVGGGAAGVELAFTLDARLRAAGREASLLLVTDTAEVLPGFGPRLRRRVLREARRRGVSLRCGTSVRAVEKDALILDAERVSCDLTLWAAGAAPVPFVENSALPKSDDGFIRVDAALRVEGEESLFAVGDCARSVEHPWVPRAGVYAVRQGPVLDANLRAALTGGRLRRYRPQRDFLALLNLGGGSALGTKWGVAFQGRPVWRLKDWIDRRFVRRFQVLDASGNETPDFPTPEQMGMEAMVCGGCAAKVGARPLEAALARLTPAPADSSVLLGLAEPDDAAALRTPGGDVVLTSIDGFRAFCDDPWLVGRVAAVNAASDVHAKGGRPRHALALVSVPASSPERQEETLFQTLSGIRAGLDPLEISLVGGHTTSGEELFVGLVISGDLPPETRPLTLAGACPGDVLILTKALGTGVLLAADMQGRARAAWLEATWASMLRPNAEAAALARHFAAHACTDVSGFGLAGHLAELLRAGGVSADLALASLPVLPGALALLQRGVRSTFHHQNVAGRGIERGPGMGSDFELLFDPQTSGGLLIALPPDRGEEALRALREAGDASAAVIGAVREQSGGAGRISVRASGPFPGRTDRADG